MAIYDPALFQAAGFDPFTTIDEVRSATDIQRERITFGSFGAIAAIIALVYILFGD
jgi:hypothetical protein